MGNDSKVVASSTTLDYVAFVQLDATVLYRTGARISKVPYA